MEIGKRWWRLILASWAALTLAGGETILAAQHPPASPSVSAGRHAGERDADIEMDPDADKDLSTNPAWSPDGKLLSFIRPAFKSGTTAHNSKAREIWGIDAATGRQSPLVSGTEITAAFGGDGSRGAQGAEKAESARQLQGYQWAPSGHALLLVCAASLAWFDLDARSSRLLATDSSDLGGPHLDDPKISPDGRTVSFIKNHTLWLADAATGAVRGFAPAGSGDALEGEPDWVYLHELGLHSAYWWSPDSSSIAWMETDDRAVDKYSLRDSHGKLRSIAYPKPGGVIPTVRLFVQAVSGSKPLQIDLGGDVNVYIPRVQWLPDGKHLAIERLSRNQKTLDLLLADAGDGTTRSILSEKDAYWIDLNDGPLFLKDSHRFLWSSERSGYRHLYLYDLSGRQIAQLTHGNWEVTSTIEVDEAAGVVYFTATEASPLERQLYRVNLDGSGMERITHERGTHEPLLSPASGVLADTWSSRVTPPCFQLLRSDGSKMASFCEKRPEDRDANPTGAIEFLSVKTHMGVDLNAWTMKPPDFDPTRQYPLILYVAGGPGEQIVRDRWGGYLSAWFASITRKGYVVLAVDNRGTAGRGHLFAEPVHLRFSAAEMADLRDSVLYLRSLPWVDKTRIGICGWGYGGFLALHGMLDKPLLFKAGFAGSPITDWHLYDAVFAERYLEDPKRNQDGYLSSSPLENAGNLGAPLLLAQATLDEKIHMEHSLRLLDELLDKGKYADILLFPSRRDLFEDDGARLILFQRLTDFFVKNL